MGAAVRKNDFDGNRVEARGQGQPFIGGVNELRRLTGTEEYVIQPRFEGHPSHIIVSVVEISNDNIKAITKEHLKQAMHATALRFLDLRLIVRLDTRPQESRLIQVEESALPYLLDKAVVMTTGDDWKLMVEKEVQSYCPGIKEGGDEKDVLPWKLCFIKNKDGTIAHIIHCADHLIEDGRSVQLFFSEFLTNLARALKKEPLIPTTINKPLFDATLSSSDRRNDAFSYLQTAKDIFKEIYRSTYATDQPPLTVDIPIKGRHYAFEFCILDPSETIAIINFSKKHGITVTSTLAGIVLTAIKQAFEPLNATKPSYYTVVLGVDLRPHYKPLSDHDAPEATFKELFGSHIDVRRDTYGVGGNNEQSFLDVAKQFDADTKSYIQSGRMIREGLHLEHYIPPIKTLAIKNNGRVGMLHYANLGVWQLPKEASLMFKLNAFHFVSPTNLIGGTVLFNAQTVDEKLNLTFTFIDEIVPGDMRQKFLKCLMSALKTLF